jgi:uncharacterized repeat protein (TIGR03803 family)
MKSKFYFSMMLCVTIAWSATAQTQLWGTAASGGANGQGTIFSADANGSNFHVEYSLVNALGAMPNGTPVLANNNKLYGVTELGGFGDSCVVYSYDPLTGIFTDIHDLYQYTQFGWEAKSGMLKAENGTLYGLCAAGGANGSGVIYEVNPFTDTYTDIFDFSQSDGTAPYGSLIQLLDGKLYGMTQSGGANNAGVLFSFDPDAAVYTKLYVFDPPTGAHPTFGKLMHGSDGKLYGTTQMGGSTSSGVIFSFDINTGVYTKLHDFDGQHGSTPNGSLIEATDGKLYGMTTDGGASGQGVLFSYDKGAGTFSDLYDFSSSSGTNPKRGVTQASNGKLYGTTNGGGANYGGVAFSYDITSGTYTKLVDFNTMLGTSPDCEIIETPMLTPLAIASASPVTQIKFGPNPVTNYIIITGAGQDDLVRLTDVLGKELASIKVSAFTKTTLDISDFPNVFFVKGQNGKASKVVRQ